jgi:hypothetical protein
MLNTKTSMATVLLILVLAIWANGQTPKERVYVWDFVDNKGQRTDLTDRLTLEFEEALNRAKCYQVLERRQIGKLLDHIKNEKAVADLDDISKKSQGEIKKITNAQIVVFGKVDDDIDSGQIKISVSFQHFDSSKEVKSIRIRRGQRFDTESRESAMKELVKEICGDSNADSIAGKYILLKNPASYIEVKSNGTIFYSFVQNGRVLQGVSSYEVEGKQIIVKHEMGQAMRGTVEKDKISFDNGDVFLRGSAETGPPSPPANPGVGITGAFFVKSPAERIVPSQLSIMGYGWDGRSDIKVIVNGQEINKRIDRQVEGNISLKGSVKELNMHDGKNEVVVVVNGARSIPYEFKQVIK